MSLIKCPECGKEFSDKASACPQCACPLPSATLVRDDSRLSVPPSESKQAEKKSNKMLDPKANAKALFRILLISIIILVGIWLLIRVTSGGKAANRFAASVIHTPIELINKTVVLEASSYQAIPLTLPYTGTLTIDLTVIDGNNINIYLVASDQIENIKAKHDFRYVPDFSSEKVKVLHRSGRLPSGTYYLLLRDKTLGFFSKSYSNIRIISNLEP